MPYAMCPICGSTTHLNIADPMAWYAERHPDAEHGALVPEPCFYCFAEIAVGDPVVTRRLVNDNEAIEPAQRGHVRAVYVNRDYEELYVVALESVRSLIVPRPGIRKP